MGHKLFGTYNTPVLFYVTYVSLSYFRHHFFSSLRQTTKKTSAFEQDIALLKDEIKSSDTEIAMLKEDILSLKSAMKHFMTNTQRVSASDSTELATMKQALRNSHKTTENEIESMKTRIVTLKQFITESQKGFLTVLHDKVAFLEDMIRYEWILKKAYSKDTHIPGKAMARMVELCFINCDDNTEVWIYLRGHSGPDHDWNCWMTHASEQDLVDLIQAIWKREEYFTITFPIVGRYFNNKTPTATMTYNHQIQELKKTTEWWFLNWPNNMRNLPGKCKTFAEDYFHTVENVLTTIHKMGLLK